MSEWIRTTDRMPEIGTVALVIANGHPETNIELKNAYELAEYTDEGWILEMWTEGEDIFVTHWMPLPEPPKKEDDQ